MIIIRKIKIEPRMTRMDTKLIIDAFVKVHRGEIQDKASGGSAIK
jgi:hypothetical protein